MSVSSHLFLTGMPRSGTTLLDKLLSIPGSSRVYSQPLPLLFAEVKRSFLDQRGQSVDFPLSDMLLSNYYEPARWLEFLRDFKIDAVYFEQITRAMQSFSGQYTRREDSAEFLNSFNADTIDRLILAYLSWLGTTDLKLAGLKETWCEEYIPFLIENGFKCLLILRDPRDVITSLNHGRGRSYGGRIKPMLYNIRTWRKSVAFSLQMSGNPDFMVIRYEDLVTRPEVVLAQVCEFLALPAVRVADLTGPVTDQQGMPWNSNSSHGNRDTISADSLGKYAEYLTPDIVNIIEALCLPEMRLFDYHNSLSIEQAEAVISSFDGSEELERPQLAGYLWSRERAEEEICRIKLLLADDYQPQYFIFERAFQRLRNGLKSRPASDTLR